MRGEERRRERDAEIVRRYVDGETTVEIAATLPDLSLQRVNQIVRRSGVPMRGRRAVITREECERSLAAFEVAGVGRGVHAYMEWNRRHPWAVSCGTLLNFGYKGRLSAPARRLPAPTIDPMPTSKVSPSVAAAWLYRNGCESWKAIEAASGRRLHRPEAATLAARARGRDGWMLAALDAICPDLLTAEATS